MAASGMFHLKFDEICRLCLKQEDCLSSIFETDEPEGTEPLLRTRIASIAPVQVDPEDGLPDLICHTCRDQVEKSYNFRLQVEISDRTLRACVETAKTVEPGQLVVKEEVPEVNEKLQQFLLDNNLTDSSAVSVILVETESGTQVLNICSVDENEKTVKAKGDEAKMRSEDDDDEDSAEENRRNSNDSDVDDLKGIRRFLKTEKRDDASSSEEMLRLTQSNVLMANENCMVDEEEDQESLPELNCQLCSETFRSLLDLKNHISMHFAKRRLSESNGGSESPGEVLPEGQEDAGDSEGGVTSMRDEDLKMEQEEEEEEEEDALMNFDIGSLARKEDPNGDDDFPRESKILWKMNKAVKVHATVFRCVRCLRKFSTSSALKNHERIHRSAEKFVCATCGKCFTKRSVLRYHEGTHVEKPPECAVCKKLFMNMQSFKMHMKRHVLGSRFACSYCAKRYYTNSELSRHVQTHLGKRAFPCELCETSFFSQPELNRHLKYHKGEKKFTCKVCCKSYFESGHLKIHERVHTGEKPFACTICSKAFFTKPKLVRHTKTHTKNQREAGEDGAERSM